MKGTIANCIQSMVTYRFGLDKWKEALRNAGVSDSKAYSTREDIPDAEIMAILSGAAQATGLSVTQVMDAFGEFWSTVYAPSIYKSFFDSAKSTRELLLKLDEIHVAMTRTLKNAKPPRFTYEWLGEQHLVMNYHSERDLVALVPGLIAGLGKFYKDTPTTTVEGNQIHVFFS